MTVVASSISTEAFDAQMKEIKEAHDMGVIDRAAMFRIATAQFLAAVDLSDPAPAKPTRARRAAAKLAAPPAPTQEDTVPVARPVDIPRAIKVTEPVDLVVFKFPGRIQTRLVEAAKRGALGGDASNAVLSAAPAPRSCFSYAVSTAVATEIADLLESKSMGDHHARMNANGVRIAITAAAR